MKSKAGSKPSPRKYGGWMTRLVRAIEKEAGPEIVHKVVKDHEEFDGTTDYRVKAGWIRMMIGRLEKAVGSETAIRIMQNCGRKCCGPTQQKRANAFMAESRSVAELLGKLNETGIGGGRLKLKNKNTIAGGYDRCYCGRVKQTEETFPTDTYCHCSVGWYKSLFEAAFGKPVEVELKQSIIQGAGSCEFVIRF